MVLIVYIFIPLPSFGLIVELLPLDDILEERCKVRLLRVSQMVWQQLLVEGLALLLLLLFGFQLFQVLVVEDLPVKLFIFLAEVVVVLWE